MSEISDRYRRRAAEVTRRVEAVPPDRWDDPSPCEGWSARDVLAHLLESQVRMPASVGLAVPTQVPVSADPVGAWAEGRDALQAILDDPARAGLEYDGMFGRTSLDRTVDDFLGMDLVVHAWDLAKATGGDVGMDPVEVEGLLGQTEEMGEMLRTPGVCGPPVAVPDDAPAQVRLLGRLGRVA